MVVTPKRSALSLIVLICSDSEGLERRGRGEGGRWDGCAGGFSWSVGTGGRGEKGAEGREGVMNVWEGGLWRGEEPVSVRQPGRPAEGGRNDMEAKRRVEGYARQRIVREHGRTTKRRVDEGIRRE
ncbi:hypothetical protein E2C01_096480 [Portunus trituberculatus]|uniref:Uncharacterized protein n=1 Tax=Portunus trituberculatus TaxID=210409 RepID=A0A5B7JSP1_PORTR|nr:hypothetical protein [Portunus trituberculatus]